MAARAAVYLRVSTDKQTAENQEPAVRALVEARAGAGAWDEVNVYRETKSAAKERPEFDAMMEAARLGKISTVFIWSLDRFGRSMFGNLRDVSALIERYGVGVVSVRESWLDNTGDLAHRKLLLGIFSWVAEHERERLQQRTRAGLDRARAAGKVLGRPRAAIPARALVKALVFREMGAYHSSWRETAAEVERVGLGKWSHATLSRECTKRVAALGAQKAVALRPGER